MEFKIPNPKDVINIMEQATSYEQMERMMRALLKENDRLERENKELNRRILQLVNHGRAEN